jgi:hypothetical protein
LVNSEGHVLLVLANDGAGAFSTREQHPVDGTTVALVDFDGDHDLDICSGGSHILSNAGDGRFAAGPPDAPWWPDANGLATGDFDGDGDQDIAAASKSTYGLWVARNDGGVFGPLSGPGHGNGEPLDIECLEARSWKAAGCSPSVESCRGSGCFARLCLARPGGGM